MNLVKRTILLKVSGELFSDSQKKLSSTRARSLIESLKKYPHYRWAIVIGGGNFFRQSKEGASLGLTDHNGHQVGMIATLMNSMILKDLCLQAGIEAVVLTAFECAMVGAVCSQSYLDQAIQNNNLIIFGGGIGVPYFSTDMAAVVRALQIEADEIWKITKVNGIYTEDPLKNSAAQLIPSLSHNEYLYKQLTVIDPAAVLLAGQHKKPIRVFSQETDNTLDHAIADTSYGSIIV